MWLFELADGAIRASYRNAVQGRTYRQGDVHTSVTPGMLLDWLVEGDQLSAGDWIVFSDGERTHVLRCAARTANA